MSESVVRANGPVCELAAQKAQPACSASIDDATALIRQMGG